MTSPTTSWEKAFRFLGDDGQNYWAAIKLDEAVPKLGSRVEAYPDVQALENSRSCGKVTVEKILAPVPAPNEPIVCLGGNYKAHVLEAKASLDVPAQVPDPTHPACMWLKSRFALAHPDSAIPVVSQAYDHFLDYEGELVIVTAKDATDVPVDEAHSYILGFTCGNDLTARMWHEVSRSAGQLGYSKGFDHFAPLGPALVSYRAWKQAPVQSLKTWVNDKKVQDVLLDTLTFSPEVALSFLSQGHTIAAGSAIMTGTPLGVGFFSDPPYSLKDGDVVDIEIPLVGRLSNSIKYLAKS